MEGPAVSGAHRHPGPVFKGPVLAVVRGMSHKPEERIAPDLERRE